MAEIFNFDISFDSVGDFFSSTAATLLSLPVGLATTALDVVTLGGFDKITGLSGDNVRGFATLPDKLNVPLSGKAGATTPVVAPNLSFGERFVAGLGPTINIPSLF